MTSEGPQHPGYEPEDSAPDAGGRAPYGGDNSRHGRPFGSRGDEQSSERDWSPGGQSESAYPNQYGQQQSPYEPPPSYDAPRHGEPWAPQGPPSQQPRGSDMFGNAVSDDDRGGRGHDTGRAGALPPPPAPGSFQPRSAGSFPPPTPYQPATS